MDPNVHTPVSLPANNHIFWMVWGPSGGAPTAKHPRYETAYGEAIRLAAKYPGKDFFVLQATNRARADAPTVKMNYLVAMA